MPKEPKNLKCPAKSWIKRFGAIGLAFFLIKGLLWLILPAAIAYFSLIN
ncbi:MAG: alanyl-tRNA synthetase [Pyrinomonadaceae bacterium]